MYLYHGKYVAILRYSIHTINYNIELQHDKTNKITCAPRHGSASTQSNQTSLCAQQVAKDPMFFHASSEDSDQTAHMSFCWFYRDVAQFIVPCC